MKLNKAYYLRPDVVQLAKELIGKILVTKLDGKLTSGIITETEAYAGELDKASHAYGGRRTTRTEIMFQTGGTAYVYLCYGIHSLFNIVTNSEGIPHAILIRAIQPFKGIQTMEERRKISSSRKNFTAGPGTVAQSLGIHYSHSGISLSGNQIWIEDQGIEIPEKSIHISARIGVGYAQEDALLPYRFYVDKIDL